MLPEEAGCRLDNYLAEKTGHTRSRVSRQIENGDVELCGRKVSGGRKLLAGDVIIWREPEIREINLVPQDMPIEIIYEDRDIIVINKPADLVVHPAPGHEDGTLVNFLLHHCSDIKPIQGELRPGIVHRLDKDTSGLMMALKNEEALVAMRRQFDNREVFKEYRALVYGQITDDELTLDAPIGRHETDRKKFSTRSRNGKPSVTHIKVLSRFSDEISYVSALLETGRTHQIRVHLSDRGFPIIGDDLYLADRRLKRIAGKALRDQLNQIQRPMLHSHKLSFRHPTSGAEMCFEQQPPQDFAELLSWLEAKYA